MVTRHRIDRLLSIEEIKANPRNGRTHSKAQIRQIAEGIKAFGFGAPLLVDETLTLIGGYGRLKAAERLNIAEIPAVQLLGLSEAQKRALALADNKSGDNAGWDRARLAIELPDLAELLIKENLDISLTGFSPVEIDQLHVDFEEDSADPGEAIDRGWQTGPVVSQQGILWVLDQHRLLCGDARSNGDLDRLVGSSRAAMAFLDVPYNVRVRSIGGRGRVKHAEFAFASGEMTPPEYVEFLEDALGNAARVSRGGAVHFVCCDWRHVTEIMEAGRLAYGGTLNIVVWVKSNAGQGSFYRSQHEFVVVFRACEAAHLNNIELGRHGRSRSNVWNYRGVNTFGAGRMEELRSHPTVKPVALVADAMRDCTRRRDMVLDTFSGSGTTIMAAERIGRRAYAMDIEPRYVDVAVRRWQAFIEWYRSTLLSRGDDKTATCIVVVMQRVHQNDLVGHLQEQGGFEVLNLPAIAQRPQTFDLGGGRTHTRQCGELLHPEHEPAHVLSELRREMGPIAFSAQYQQTPIPPGGTIIKRKWLTTYDEIASQPGDRIVMSWDIALSEIESGDYSACVVLLIRKEIVYILEVVRGRFPFEALKKKVMELKRRYNPSTLLIEDSPISLGLIQSLREQSINVTTYKPDTDKRARLINQTDLFAGGSVRLPRRAGWLEEFVAELLSFPGRHDDQVDALTQGLAWGRQRWSRKVVVSPLRRGY